MKIKALTILIVCFSVTACGGNFSTEKIRVCHGVACNDKIGHSMMKSEIYKPTMEERLRILRGEKPNFGSERVTIGIDLPW